jgi:predicted lysophospholipase L1 biosynthesis ABC-type transport system permease subunit
MEAWLYDGRAPWLTVVGVVDDVRHDGHESETRPELYVLYRQVPRWTRGMNVVVRGAGGGEAGLGAVVRDAIRASDPLIAAEIGSLDDRVAGLLRERVLTQRMLVGFGLAAVLLVCLGVYGLVAHAAAQRTRELAVRVALGAPRSGLLGLMVLAAGRVIGLGTLAGLVTAWALAGLLESLLVGVPPTDPWTYAASAALLGAVGLIAAVIPSLRAARIDPVEALRGE